MERRTFIIGAVAGGVGLVEYAYVTRYMNGLLDPRPLSVKAYERYGEKAALVALTSNEDFYVTSKGAAPAVSAATWQLRFDGLVRHSFAINYSELLALPRIERELTLECISNPIGGNALGNAQWTGTPLQPLLERAAPLKEASFAVIYAADGYSTGHPISRLWNAENFLAYKMNGEDLPAAHGYPARVFIPGKFGMKQPKWITRIQLVNKPYLGYWEKQGWSDDSERWAHARFSDLRDGAKLPAVSPGGIELTGYALGNLDGIQAVEISFDDGNTWKQTDLFSNPSPLTWAFWKHLWAGVRPGKYKLRLRAIDGRGRVEEPRPRGIFPDGATGQQVVKVTVV